LPLVLLIEPGALEFYCHEGHALGIERFIPDQARGARAVLREELAVGEQRRSELLRISQEADKVGLTGPFSRRLGVMDERLEYLKRTLTKLG